MKNQFLYVFPTLDEKVISSFLVLIGDKRALTFLSGTLEEYYNYRPEALVELTIIKWLKDEALTKYILGGGHKWEYGIYFHKKDLARNGDHPFYVGKKIHDSIIYEKLIEFRKKRGNYDMETSFFPKYKT